MVPINYMAAERDHARTQDDEQNNNDNIMIESGVKRGMVKQRSRKSVTQ